MSNSIPNPIIGFLSEKLPEYGSHSDLNNIFQQADAPGEPPQGSKSIKISQWLARINKDSECPLLVLGRILSRYLDFQDKNDSFDFICNVDTLEKERKFKCDIESLLKQHNLTYYSGGIIAVGGAMPSKSLFELIKNRDIPSIDAEFDRALSKINTEPREAVSAACNILEAVFKVYIDDNKDVVMPAKQDLSSVWKVVRSDLGFDPGLVQDNDLRKILSGVFSIVDGVGALRTHASSAHGDGRKIYNLKPRHASLAINSAHTIALFVLETWDDSLRRAKN
ncbi:abortive infection family protein [Cobetia marina]|uniref:abortive infection family protein n=1 Tax=Cobetia marina TaxID=28258 RepID=UPI0026E391CF|nr:abortive infection family protein [Cobetia marina]MDO6786094.1 abortive infection family protein [Cobetia marina]